MVKSSELTVSCEGAVTVLALLAFRHWFQGSALPLEVLFPAHILYYLLTFSFSCPGSNVIRKFCCVLGLVFGDTLVTAVVLQHALPTSFPMLSLQFLAVFTVVHLLDPTEVAKLLAVHHFRGFLFLLEGLLKSTMLVSTLQEVVVIYQEVRVETVMGAVAMGSLRLLLPPCVYCVDQYLFQTQRVGMVSSDDMVRYLRLAPLLCLIATAALVATLPRLPELQEVGYTPAHLLLNLFFLAWFGWNAVNFGRKPQATSG